MNLNNHTIDDEDYLYIKFDTKEIIGGIEVYCFGAIAAQGIAILIDKGVSMFDSKNIAIIALVCIIGLGGQYAFGGNIPF